MIEKIQEMDDHILSILTYKFTNSFPNKESIKNDINYNPYINYLVYKIDQEIVGIISYTIIYERIEINQLEVIEEKKRKGIATDLLTYIINIANQKKLQNITLEVKINNKIAITLYKKFGFEIKALRKGYYQGIDGYLMERRI